MRPSTLGALLGLTFVVIVTGCAWTEATREKIHEQNVITGSVSGVPVELRHDRVVERAQDSNGTRDTGLEALAPLASGIASTGVSALTGGAGGLALGLVGMGIAYWKKRQSDTALGQVVGAIEVAKTDMPRVAVDSLHNSLSKALDVSVKTRIKSIKKTRKIEALVHPTTPLPVEKQP